MGRRTFSDLSTKPMQVARGPKSTFATTTILSRSNVKDDISEEAAAKRIADAFLKGFASATTSKNTVPDSTQNSLSGGIAASFDPANRFQNQHRKQCEVSDAGMNNSKSDVQPKCAHEKYKEATLNHSDKRTSTVGIIHVPFGIAQQASLAAAAATNQENTDSAKDRTTARSRRLRENLNYQWSHRDNCGQFGSQRPRGCRTLATQPDASGNGSHSGYDHWSRRDTWWQSGRPGPRGSRVKTIQPEVAQTPVDHKDNADESKKNMNFGQSAFKRGPLETEVPMPPRFAALTADTDEGILRTSAAKSAFTAALTRTP